MHDQRVGQPPKRPFGRPRVQLWALAVLLFGIGDVATTLYFIATTPATEANPVVATVIGVAGLWVLVPWKVLTVALFYGLYRATPNEWQVGVPIGLVLVGGVVSVWNLYVGLYGGTLF